MKTTLYKYVRVFVASCLLIFQCHACPLFVEAGSLPQHLSPESMLSSEDQFEVWLGVKLHLLLKAIEKNNPSDARPVAQLAQETFQGAIEWLGEEMDGPKRLYRFKVNSALIVVSYDTATHLARLESAEGVQRAVLDHAMEELVDLEREYLLITQQPDEEPLEFPGYEWVGPLLDAHQRLMVFQESPMDAGFATRVGLHTTRMEIKVYRTLARHPTWLTMLVARGAVAALEAHYGIDHQYTLVLMAGAVSNPWAGEKYLAISYEELHKTLRAARERLEDLATQRNPIAEQISSIRDTLRKYLGPNYRDVDVQRQRWARLNRIRTELRSKPQPWKVAPEVFQRAESQELNKGLYEQWEKLEARNKELDSQIAEVQENIFKTEAMLEIKDLFAQLVKLYEWRNRIQDDHGTIMAHLKDMVIERGQPVVEFSKHKWLVREKRFKAELENTVEKIYQTENAIRAAFFVLERQTELLTQVDRHGLLRFYQTRQEKLPFASQLIRILEHFQTKASPIGVDRAYPFSSDIQEHWLEFIEACGRRGITLRNVQERKLEVRWEKMPDKVFELGVVPAKNLPSLGRTDVNSSFIRLSAAAFTSGLLAAETLEQELDNFLVQQEENVGSLVKRILNSLERISNLNEVDRQSLVKILDPANVNGIDTLGFNELVGHYQQHGIDMDLLDRILSYVERASSIYPLESQTLRHGYVIESSL